MKIRESFETDKAAIRNLHLEAFGAPEGDTVSQLAIEMINDPSAQPILSLVAETEGFSGQPGNINNIAGHILFTRISVDSAGIKDGYILAPLAVAKGSQGCGLGTVLIEEGLSKLKELGASFVMVLGDPKYYGRAGFHTNHNLAPPYPLDYPEAWMAQELTPGVLHGVKGTVRCCESLSAPEHW